MATTDGITYGRAARLRVALASLAAEIAESARGQVTTYADSYAHGGEFIEAANGLAGDARFLLTLAAAYERARGTSWEAIGETLGITRQSAHTRFAEDIERLNKTLTESWLLGDEPRLIDLPEGAADPAGTADRLDRWAIRHRENTDPLAYKDEDDPARARPVSAGLPAMDALEHSTMVLTGVNLIHERHGAVPDDPARYDEETRVLELGLARRKIELYERMLAEETGHRGRTGTGTAELADLLAGARVRLAELESTTESQ